MNLALPVLLLLSALPASGFVVRRRRPAPWAVAWGVMGLAVTALFAPALALPDGIPSPSASLAEHAPWSGADELDGLTGNPVLGDVTHQIEPWLLFSRRELRAGRLPLWNPHQFSGTPFWANGQAAPLHPLHLLFAALPTALLPLGWILLPWLRLVVAGLGARALARALGVGETGALYAALAFALSGMLVGFALYPMGNALALVPWVLAATERLTRRWEDGGAGLVGPAGWLAAAVGLQLLGGHPATAVHTGLLSVLFLVVRLGPRRWVRAVRGLLPAWGLAWIVGAAVAAVHLVPFAMLLGETSRWQGWAAGGGGGEPWWLFLVQPLRLVLPDLYGNPAEGTWWGPFNYLATAVYAGALALPLAAAGFMDRGRGDSGTRGRRALAVVGLFALAAAYHLPGLHDLLTSLPVVGRAPSHRLIFAVILTLAVLGGAGLERWRDALVGRLDPASRRRLLAGLAGGAILALGLLTVATALYRGDWEAHGLVGEQVVRTSAVALGAVGLLGVALFVRRLRRPAGVAWAMAAVLVFVALDLVSAHDAVHPALRASALYPETGAVRALVGSDDRLVATGSTLRPNAALVYGLYDVRGDDPVKLAAYDRLLGERFGGAHPTYFRPVERLDPLWLDRLSVRWVMTSPDAADDSLRSVWHLAYRGEDAMVWERPTPLPLARWAVSGRDGSARVEILERLPGWYRLAFERGPGPRAAERDPLLVVAESWAPGWTAWLDDGTRVPVDAAGDVLLGLRPPVAQGVLTVSYRPPGLVAGAWVSLAGVLSLCWMGWIGGKHRPARGPAASEIGDLS